LNKNQRGKAAGVAIPVELDCDGFKEAWEKWVAYRRKRRLSLLPDTLSAQLASLARLGSDGAALEIANSIKNGWQSICYENGANGNGNGYKQRTAVGPGQRHPADRERADGVL